MVFVTGPGTGKFPTDIVKKLLVNDQENAII